MSGYAGHRVSFPVTLHTLGLDIAGVQNDIRLDPPSVFAVKPNLKPDCAPNPAIDKNATGFAFLKGSSSQDCALGKCPLRAFVLAFDNVDPIPDGSVLYTCSVDIPPGAAVGAYPIVVFNTEAGTPAGDPLPAAPANGLVFVVAGASAAERAVRAAVSPVDLLCAGGPRDGAACAADADCPDGACASAQGVCDGGDDDGLLCDCAGGSCSAATASCSSDPGSGTCSGGSAQGRCCRTDFNCAGRRPCVATQKVCAGGIAKGMPCLRDGQCAGSTCGSTGRLCKGGSFDGFSCVDHGDCPLGFCAVRAQESGGHADSRRRGDGEPDRRGSDRCAERVTDAGGRRDGDADADRDFEEPQPRRTGHPHRDKIADWRRKPRLLERRRLYDHGGPRRRPRLAAAPPGAGAAVQAKEETESLNHFNSLQH